MRQTAASGRNPGATENASIGLAHGECCARIVDRDQRYGSVCLQVGARSSWFAPNVMEGVAALAQHRLQVWS